jgi:hypothetical protein
VAGPIASAIGKTTGVLLLLLLLLLLLDLDILLVLRTLHRVNGESALPEAGVVVVVKRKQIHRLIQRGVYSCIGCEGVVLCGCWKKDKYDVLSLVSRQKCFSFLEVGDKGTGWSLAKWGEEWDKEGGVSVDRVSHWGLAKKKERGKGNESSKE